MMSVRVARSLAYLCIRRCRSIALVVTDSRSFAQGTSVQTFLPLVIGRSEVVNSSGCNPSQGHGGLASGVHETVVANRPAVVVVGEGYDPSKPTLLAFYLHGSEKQYNHSYEWADHPITQLVNQRGWVFVSPLWTDNVAPETPEETLRSMQEDGKNYVNILNEMFAQYNVCRDFILGSSASLGSASWTGFLFPWYGKTHTAHMVLHCGAGMRLPHPVFGEEVKQLGTQETALARTELHFVFGTGDFLIQEIRDTIAVYQTAGFRVEMTGYPDKGHCTYSTDADTARIWQQMATQADDILPQ